LTTELAADEAADLPFRQVAQHLQALCWISDAEGQIVWVNDAWFAYTGMTPQAIRAQGLRGLHDPALYPEVVRRWEEAKAVGEMTEMVFPLKGQDGRLRPFHTRVTPVRDAAGRVTRWFGCNNDVSAQIAAERGLRSVEDRFRRLADNLPVMIWESDAAAEMVWRNRAFESFWDLAPETPTPRTEAVIHPDDRDRVKAEYERAWSSAQPLKLEARIRRGDGEWRALRIEGVPRLDDSGGVQGYMGAAFDVTESRLRAQTLADEAGQMAENFRLLVAAVVDYALFTLSPEGIVVNWNAGARRIKGYAAEEIVGRHFSVFYTEADRVAGAPQAALATAAREGRFEAEAWRVRKDGSLFWANVVIDAIRDDDGKLVGFAKITRDMTERRAAQLELQRARDRLAQAQKLEAVGQLTGGVAHDFNNLLMVVGGQTELLRTRLGQGDARVARALDAIDQSIRRGQDLTRHLLTFSRRQRVNPAPMDLAERAGALREILGAGLGPSITLEIDLPPDLWRVRVDASEMELALLNLVINARDAMPAGGRILLQGRNLPAGSPELGGEESGDCVAIALSDTGMGIPDDILQKVFEPFFTTKGVDKGTGLGLSQVYGFVTQASGRVDVASELNRGSTVTLFLPRCEAEEEVGQAPPEPCAVGHAHVLLVEDNPEVAEVAAELLAELGHTARTVTSADAALAALEAGERPHLILTDIVMAGTLDGYGLARRVRECWPQMAVVLATGYSEAAQRMPANEFPLLAKPYHLADLEGAVRAALAATAQAA
jgi:PAS domain S-box-containing protein